MANNAHLGRPFRLGAHMGTIGWRWGEKGKWAAPFEAQPLVPLLGTLSFCIVQRHHIWVGPDGSDVSEGEGS